VALLAKLTPKQKKFANEYLIDLNATQAAIRAGYSSKTARSIGQRLLTYVDVQNYMEQRMKSRNKRVEISQDMVINELAKIAFANTTDYVQVQTKGRSKKVIVKDTSALNDDQLAAISSIKDGANGIELKLHDKQKALELLARHLGLFNDKVQVVAQVDIDNKIAYTDDELDGRIKELEKKLGFDNDE
jgi:phage terminase small subunit